LKPISARLKKLCKRFWKRKGSAAIFVAFHHSYLYSVTRSPKSCRL